MFDFLLHRKKHFYWVIFRNFSRVKYASKFLFILVQIWLKYTIFRPLRNEFHSLEMFDFLHCNSVLGIWHSRISANRDLIAICALLLGGKIFNKKWPPPCASHCCYISLIRFSIRSRGTAVSHITGCDSIIFVHCEQTKWHLSLMHRSSLQFPQFLSWNLATWRSIKEWPSLR